LEGRTVEIYAGDEYLFSALVSKKGWIRVRKDKEAGKSLKFALSRNLPIRLRVVS